MNPVEFWKKIGKQLREARDARDWSASKVEREGGPSYKTILTIEHGRIGNLQNLERHAEALGHNVLDLFQSTLASEADRISPECAQILRAYEGADVHGRAALVAMAVALLEAPPPSASGRSPAGPRGSGPRKL